MSTEVWAFLLTVVVSAIAAVVVRRRYAAIQAKLRFLEQREEELTQVVIALSKEMESIRTTKIEMDRILPPLRSAIATFQKFNEIY